MLLPKNKGWGGGGRKGKKIVFASRTFAVLCEKIFFLHNPLLKIQEKK
ncbi:MAG: hypothetical protein IPQ05_06780 [Leptospiraceae bacterium]|nr:hypothetical protein [Leptospiraceae bacterium]